MQGEIVSKGVPRFGEPGSKVWRPGENAFQGLENFPKTATKVRKMSEKRIQGLEDRRLHGVQKSRRRSAAEFRAVTGMESVETCFFTRKACPAARSCAFSAAEALRRDGRGRPAVTRSSMCRTAIECNLECANCGSCVKRAKCNTKNNFKLFRCFRLERKRSGE